VRDWTEELESAIEDRPKSAQAGREIAKFFFFKAIASKLVHIFEHRSIPLEEYPHIAATARIRNAIEVVYDKLMKGRRFLYASGPR